LKNRAYAWRLVAVAVIALAADCATKAIARSAVQPGGHRRLVPGVVLVHLQRTGLPSGFTLAAALLMITAAAVGRIWHPCRPERSLSLWLPAGLLVGGAASNLLERAMSGATTEWISLPLAPPVCLADLDMLVGATLLFFIAGASRHRAAHAKVL